MQDIVGKARRWRSAWRLARSWKLANTAD